MSDAAPTRRLFLQALAGSGALLGLGAPALEALAAAASDARDADEAFRILDADEARDFAAIAARIIPTTGTPGATEAGVIHFFDQAFAGDMAGSLAAARAGLDELNTGIGEGRFAELPPDEQDRMLSAIEGERFFELMRLMTLFGFLAMSRYGGNRDNVGWQLLGFEGHHGPWQYPFGHYDASEHDHDE